MESTAELRKVRVQAINNPGYVWNFEYDPSAEPFMLQELTKQCSIAPHPDCEYYFSIECNDKTYHLYSDGDGALRLMCMLCIKLDDQTLDAVLAANHDDIWMDRE